MSNDQNRPPILGPIRLGQPSSPGANPDLKESRITADDTNPALTAAGISPPAAPKVATAEPDPTKSGRILARQLEEQGYHPVFIFGTAFSGKTAMLSSLLAYPQAGVAREMVEISLGDPLLPLDDAYGRQSHDYAEYIFNHAVQRYIDGNIEASSQWQQPFFLPVVLKPHNGPEVKLAFLESRGEWFEPRHETNALYQPLRAEISGVLKHFGKGVSMIYVAPYTQIKLWDDDTGHQANDIQLIKTANLGLRGGITSYGKVRTNRDSDAHMFLITKWDAHAQPGSDQDLFTSPTLEQLEHVAKTKYTTAYNAFMSMTSSTKFPWQKTLRHYCAGTISGQEVLRPNESNQEIIYGFPMRLWNWIYGNATRDATGVAKQLYTPPKADPPTISDRWNQFMSSILRRIGV